MFCLIKCCINTNDLVKNRLYGTVCTLGVHTETVLCFSGSGTVWVDMATAWVC